MTSLFISPESDIKIEIWIAHSDGKFLNWNSEAEMSGSEFGRSNPEQVVHVEAHFREPNFRDASEISDLAMAMKSDGGFSMSVNQVRAERFVRLIKSWNLKDAEGKAIQPNRHHISQLHPTVAQILMLDLEEKLGIVSPTDNQVSNQ